MAGITLKKMVEKVVSVVLIAARHGRKDGMRAKDPAIPVA